MLTADSLLYYPSATEPTPKGGVDLTVAGLGVGTPLDTEDPFNPSSDAAVAAAYPAAFVVRPRCRPLVHCAPSSSSRRRTRRETAGSSPCRAPLTRIRLSAMHAQPRSRPSCRRANRRASDRAACRKCKCQLLPRSLLQHQSTRLLSHTL
jgi:hypothetical protein